VAIGFLTELVPVDHPKFKQVESGIFTKRVVSDCLGYTCREREPTRIRLDACCQYGADCDVGERDQILAHADEIKRLLTPAAAAAPWFLAEVEHDKDFPSGMRTRTATFGDNLGCVFLQHDKRGCAIHRASIDGGWSIDGVKPGICRLFPLTWDEDSIGLADDYTDYTCAFEPDAPTVYRNGRDTLGALFGADLVVALDAVEARLTADAKLVRRLPQVS
jgi:Fe-S-cluster containining protein